MDASDLFSFLDAPETNEDASEDVHMEIEPPANLSEDSKKRKVDSASGPSVTSQSQGVAADDNEAGPSAPKKPRMASPKPVVVDEVEIEAKREVAASAGLMGPVEAGARLELRHQVRCKLLQLTFELTIDAGPPPSCCSSWLPVYTNRQPCTTS